MKEYRVKSVRRWVVTEWTDYRGGFVRQLAEVPGVDAANEIAEAFGRADPEAMVNLGYDAPDPSYGLGEPADHGALAAPRKAEPTPELIKQMVERFLTWRLPENFNPDGGVSFKRLANEGTAHERRNEPWGTNLLDAVQAEAMVRHMLGGIGATDASPAPPFTPEEEALRALPHNIATARRRAARAAGDEGMLQMLDRCQVAIDV